MCMIAILLSACVFSQKENKENQKEEESTQQHYIELNERQKEILRSEGLPESVKDLGLNQLNAIIEIENVLQYMEEKYGKTFCYSSFIEQGLLNGEEAHVYEEGTPKERLITVKTEYNEGNRHYVDDYKEVQAADLYNQVMAQHCKDAWGIDPVILTDIYRLQGEVTAETVIKNSTANVRIYFSDPNANQVQLDKMANELKDWLVNEQNKAPGDYRIFAMSPEAIKEFKALNVVNRYTAEDVTNKYKFDYRSRVWITEDGFADIMK